jgi:hypothetical protein
MATELANTKLSKTPTKEDTPISLTIGWGMLIEDRQEYDAIYYDL